MERRVEPELLDELPKEDPRAQRSRKDLRLINFLMGNERWILRHVGKERIIELGAGSGDLTRKLQKRGQVTGLDLQKAPDDLRDHWHAGDLLETLPEIHGEVVVANLILHHFQDEELARLGTLLKKRKRLIIVEPWRSRLTLAEAYSLYPLINDVTRHDMIISIRAGFRKGELSQLFNLGPEWQWREEVSCLGAIRLLAWRK